MISNKYLTKALGQQASVLKDQTNSHHRRIALSVHKKYVGTFKTKQTRNKTFRYCVKTTGSPLGRKNLDCYLTKHKINFRLIQD